MTRIQRMTADQIQIRGNLMYLRHPRSYWEKVRPPLDGVRIAP